MQKLQQLLINKYAVYGTFAILVVLRVIAPIPSIDNSQPYFSIMPASIAQIVVYTPTIALVLLFMHRKVSESRFWRVFNINIFLLTGYLVLTILAILQVWSLTVMPIAARGSLISWAMLISLSMAIAYKLRSMSGAAAILAGIIASFWVVGFFETPFQICCYYLAGRNLILSQVHLIPVVQREAIFFFPFIILFFAMKIKLTRASLLCAALFAILWTVWVVAGHFQTLYIVDLSVSTTRSFISDPINWTWYTVSKTCKVMLVLSVFFLNYNSLAKGDNYEAILDNKPI